MRKCLYIELNDDNYYQDRDVEALELYLKLIFGNRVGITTVYESDEEMQQYKESGWIEK
jgi:hypothetical protein